MVQESNLRMVRGKKLQSNKKLKFYSIFKKESQSRTSESSDYIKKILITRVRQGNRSLGIETGTPDYRRLCVCCNENKVEDETHSYPIV